MKSNRFSLTPCLLLIALGLWSGQAHAQLAGLVHDPVAGELRVAEIDSANGTFTTGTGAVTDCCQFTSGLISTNSTTDQFYALGTFTGGALVDQLGVFTLGYDGTTVSASIVADTPESVLEYDEQLGVLISMKTVDLATGMQLIGIDPTSGAVTPFPTNNVDCCEIVTGVSALDSAARRLYFAGRQAGEATWSVYVADLNSGVAVPFEVLPSGAPGFMGLSPNGTTLEVMMQSDLLASSQLIGIDLAGGGSTVLAEYSDSQCCLLTPGQTPSNSQDGESWWLAGSNTGLEDALMAMTRNGLSGLTRIQALDPVPGVHLLAVVVDGNTVSLDILFSDRFQL
ncbi:MAG: hypothetical protein AAGJ52_02580 [Pseudomonadota bacterium]